MTQDSSEAADGPASRLQKLATQVCIIGSGPAAHTAAVYAARAQLQPLMFEGMLANGIAAGGQLTTTTDVENYPGFPEGIGGWELCELFRKQSARFGTRIYTETVARVDLSRRPFKVYTDKKAVAAGTVIVATGATAKRLDIPGAQDGEGGFWNKGVSACAVCDGAAPIFRNKPLAVVGGGDTAMEEAMFLTRFASKVYVIHRRDELRASKIMQQRALSNSKIEMVWSHVVTRAFGESLLTGLRIQSTKTGEERTLDVGGMFFAIGHTPATAFLQGQLDTDEQGYVLTEPGTSRTNVEGVFAAGDVQDKQWRQAVTAAGTGCIAALEAERWLNEHEHEAASIEALRSDGNKDADVRASPMDA